MNELKVRNGITSSNGGTFNFAPKIPPTTAVESLAPHVKQARAENIYQTNKLYHNT